jgi:hypothetical protein
VGTFDNPDNRLAGSKKPAKVRTSSSRFMTNPTAQKPLSKAVLILIALAVVALGVVFAFLATIGDDVPDSLPPASESSSGD